MREKTIVIADDHVILRQGIISLLHSKSHYKVIGEASNGVELIEKYENLNPDIILSDIQMRPLDGFEAFRKIKLINHGAKCLFLSMYNDDETVYNAIKIGARGVISKSNLFEDLIRAISLILTDKQFFLGLSDLKLDILVDRYESILNTNKNNQKKILSKNEQIVLAFVGQGLSSKEIAERLFVSRRTIDSHRANIMRKFNFKTLPELIVFAVKYNLERTSHMENQ